MIPRKGRIVRFRGAGALQSAAMKRAKLKAKEERRLLRGHRWVYRNEFSELPTLNDGEVVDVYAAQGRFVGRGFYQAEGGIAVRLIADSQTEINGDFLRKAIERARVYRERIYPGQDVYRWIFGESDGLPGLVADRFGPVVSAQTPSAFYEAYAEDIAAFFIETEGVECVRLDIRGRALKVGTAPSPVEIEFDGLRFRVDIDSGQKTGMFLDQRENAAAMEVFAPGARVLDGHCYSGLWSCHAGRAGATEVLGVDTSAGAIQMACANATANGLSETCHFECADVRDVLARGNLYDVVLLDPPALAKTRSQQKKALGLYQGLNRAAMDAVKPGGVLITSTCSHFVDPEAFLEVLKRSARACQREAWIVDVRGAARDHPVLMEMPESAYLACVTLRVL